MVDPLTRIDRRADPAEAGAASRIATLDLIRGVAVLGILAVNIAGFAGPMAAADAPMLLAPGTHADAAAVLLVWLVFEGKMRALFGLLFGAGICLFVARAEAAGRSGAWLEARRLFWLLLFGWLHYLLFWWGDILFVYACGGALALALRRLAVPQLAVAALLGFAVWHGQGMTAAWPEVRAEEAVRTHAATLAQAGQVRGALAERRSAAAGDLAQAQLPFTGMIADKWRHAPAWPLVMTAWTLGETVPLMLLGMALYRTGFFTGGWDARALRRTAWWGVGLGGACTLALLGWAGSRGFPSLAMVDITGWYAAPAHLAMALGYAAALVLAAPRLLATRLGMRFAAAGRMAFSNYLLTTAAMTALFDGWGLGLIGRVGYAAQGLFVLAGWAAMLGWSAPWLARFRRGPLEWLWRSLTEWRMLPFRRRIPA